MIEMILAGIGGVVTPVATNLIKGIFGSKDKKLETEAALSANAVELAKIAVEQSKSDNEFEIARQKTIAETFKSGVAWVDGLNGLIRVIFGLAGAVVLIASVIGYIEGRETLLSPQNLASIVFYMAGYYFSELSCKKVF
jgi:hypothetical protein